jgi:biotin transport system substrate-specific component
MAYPVSAGLISFLWRRMGRGFSMALVSAALGDLLILISGAAWLATGIHAVAWSAIASVVLTFAPGDALKVAAAAGIAVLWQRTRTQSQSLQ